MMNSLPLDVPSEQAEGAIDEYKQATREWTPAMQDSLEAAAGEAQRSDLPPFLVRFDFQCPACAAPVEGIRRESVTLYGRDDFHHMGKPVAEAELVTMEDCGHAFRRPRAGSI